MVSNAEKINGKIDSGVIIAKNILRKDEFLVDIKEEIMLVLTRGLKQKIEIGDQLVTVTVLEVKGGRVRLGIEAPESVSIRRLELLEAAGEPLASGMN